MFNALYFVRQDDDSCCCDYANDECYFTFVFRDGACFEWNERADAIAKSGVTV